MARLKFKATERGFAIAEFTDFYGNECSIQRSSIATEDCIWLGVDRPHPEIPDAKRMHLSREQVATLLPALTRFATRGKLPGER